MTNDIESKEPKKAYDELTVAEVQDALATPTPNDEIIWVAQNGSLWENVGIWSALALATVDARYIMARLDEECGAFNWQSKTEFVGGLQLTGLGIRNPEKRDEWIWKWDTGQEREIHTQVFGGGKSLISKGIKRAGYQWGIARDTYDYPKPRVNCKIRVRKSDKQEFFVKWEGSVWAVLGQEGRGESPETGRVHTSRVDDVGTAEIEATATSFYDIAYGRLKYDQVQANEIAATFVDEKTSITDWDKAIGKLEEALPPDDRLYTIQEIEKAKKLAEEGKAADA